MRLLSWQVRTMLLIGIAGPPVASLILMTATYFCFVTLKCNDVSQLRGKLRIADSVAAWRLSCRACICRITSS
jgi:hypothetical protein